MNKFKNIKTAKSENYKGYEYDPFVDKHLKTKGLKVNNSTLDTNSEGEIQIITSKGKIKKLITQDITIGSQSGESINISNNLNVESGSNAFQPIQTDTITSSLDEDSRYRIEVDFTIIDNTHIEEYRAITDTGIDNYLVQVFEVVDVDPQDQDNWEEIVTGQFWKSNVEIFKTRERNEILSEQNNQTGNFDLSAGTVSLDLLPVGLSYYSNKTYKMVISGDNEFSMKGSNSISDPIDGGNQGFPYVERSYRTFTTETIVDSVNVAESALSNYDLFVSSSYTGGNSDGSAIKPYTDIQTAIDNANDGDSILVDGIFIITSEITLPDDKSLYFFGTENTVVKYSSFVNTNGKVINQPNTGCLKDYFFYNIDIANSGDYGVYIRSAKEVRFNDCKFYNNGWSGSGLSTVLADDGTTLGYDSDQADLQAFWASTETSNGGAMRLRNSIIVNVVDCEIYNNLRGLRIQDCGVGGYGFISRNQCYNNIESGIYLASDTYNATNGCENFTIYNNASKFNANNGILVVGGINNVISLNIVEGNWNAGIMGWHVSNTRFRDLDLTNNNRSEFNGIGNIGDAHSSITIGGNTARANREYIADILSTEVYNTGLGSNTSRIGFQILEDVQEITDDYNKTLINIDNVGFKKQDYAVDVLADLDIVKLTLGDCRYIETSEKNVNIVSGYYYELPFSNHHTDIKEIDVSLDNTNSQIILKEGVTGNVLNPYAINTLQAVAFGSKIRLVLKSSNKIQLEVEVSNTTINGVAVNSVLATALNQLNNIFNATVSFIDNSDPVDSFSLVSNDLTITLDSGTSFTVDVTTLGVDENKFVTSGALNGSDIDLTMNDSSVVSIDVSNMASGFTTSLKPSITNQSFDITENEAFTVQIALDSNSNIVNQYGEIDAPTWAVINQETGIFSGTAPAYNGSSDSYVINCKAANAIGGSVSFTITLNVIEKVYTNTKSLLFEDGVNSYLGGNAALVTSLERSSNGSGASDAWTIAFWYKRGSSNTGQTLFYFGGNDLANTGHIEIKNVQTNRIRLRYGSTNNYLQIQTPVGSIGTGWTHLVVSYDGGTTGSNQADLSDYYSRFKIYVNGTLQTSLSTTHNNYGWNGSIVGQNYRFGRLVSGNYPKDVKLNQLAIWNSDQSSNVTGLYNGGATQDISDLVAGSGSMNTDYLPPAHYYEIETSVTTIEDLAGTAHFVGYNFSSSDLKNDTP